MNIIRPHEITSANVVGSNVALEPAWVAGTYALGDQVRHNDILWECVADSTEESPGAGTDWAEIGPTNRMAAFDGEVGVNKGRVLETKTTNPDIITFQIEGLAVVSGIAFFELAATRITITATEITTGDAGSYVIDLPDQTQYQGSLWRWFFLPIERRTQYVNLNLGIPAGVTIDVTIENQGATAAVGAIVMGTVENVAVSNPGAQWSLSSRAKKEVTTFGTSLTRRPPSYRITYLISVLGGAAEFKRLVQALDGLTAVFVTCDDQFSELTSYGFVESVDATAKTATMTRASMVVHSL